MKSVTFLVITLLGTGLAGTSQADPGRDAILRSYAAQARTADSTFGGFQATRGETLFRAVSKSGKAETPSCTTCHGEDPRKAGQTRAGKPIEPLVVSVTPARFTDAEKVEKWFLRNCTGVLGRECTVLEKGDFITFLSAR
ncbi:MAG: DUF1924 domain-containing protein [Alphaproteobacteria bacterium]